VSIGWTNEGPQFYGVKEEEPVEKEMTATQTGAKEIAVSTTDAFTGTEEFTVMKGAVELVVTSVDFDEEDMSTAYLTLDLPIKDAEYTVICSDEEYDVATFTGEEAEVDSIIWSGEELILDSNAATSGHVGVITLDQFGDPIKSDLAKTNFTAAGATVNNFAFVDNPANTTGLLTLTPLAGTFTPGSQVTVTVVYAGNTKTAQTTLTVSAASVVDHLEVGELTLDTSTAAGQALIGKRVTSQNLATGLYYLPIEAYDQYGNELTKTQLNNMAGTSLFVTPASTSTTGVIKAKNADATLITELDDGTLALYVTGDGTSYGVGTINILSTSGFTTTASVPVYANEVIADVSIVLPELRASYDNEMMLVAENQYGEPVDLYDELTAGSITITGTGTDTITINQYAGNVKTTVTTSLGTFAGPVKDDELEIVGFAFNPGDNAGKTAVLTTVTGLGTADTDMYTVADGNIATGISGVNPLTVSTTIGGINTQVDLATAGNVIFTNNYGELMDGTNGAIPTFTANTAGNTPGNMYYTVDAPATLKCTTMAAAVISQDAAKTGSDTYTISLKQADANGDLGDALATKLVTINVAEAEYVSYIAETVATEGLLRVGTAGDKATIKVYGVDKNGNKVQLRDGYALAVDSDLDVVQPVNATADGYVKDMASTAYDPTTVGIVTDTAKVSVIVAGKPVTTVDVNFSNAPSVAMGAVIMKATDVTDNTTYVISTDESATIANNKTASVTMDEDGYQIIKTDSTGNKGYVIAIIDQYALPMDNQEVAVGDSANKYSEGADGQSITLTYGTDKTTTIIVSSGKVSYTFNLVGNEIGTGTWS